MKTFPLPIDDDLLRNYDFFDLYPMDGGGRFSFQDMFGTIRDDLIAGRVFDAGELPGAGKLPYINFKQFERWRAVEKSCGLNKFSLPWQNHTGSAAMTKKPLLQRTQSFISSVNTLPPGVKKKPHAIFPAY